MTIPHLYFTLLGITSGILGVILVTLVMAKVRSGRTRVHRMTSSSRSLIRATYRRRTLQRIRAVEQIGALRRRGEVWRLEELLSDRDTDVRIAAAQALGKLKTPTAAWALVKGLERAALPEAWLIEQLGKAWAADVITDALVDPQLLAIRAHLCEAAGLALAVEAERSLLQMLRIGTSVERTSAARALRLIGSHTATRHLIRALDDASPQVRSEAALALGEIADPGSVFALERALHDPDWWVQANAATALAKLGRRGRRALGRLLMHPDRVTRERAREVISTAALDEDRVAA